MRAQYIIEAIRVLDQCAAALESPEMAPETRGRLLAKCFIATNALKWHSGICEVDVAVDHVEVAA